MLKPRFRIAWKYIPTGKKSHTLWSWNITMAQIVYPIRYGTTTFIQWVETEYIESNDPCTCRTSYCRDIHCPIPEHKLTGGWRLAQELLDKELNGREHDPSITREEPKIKPKYIQEEIF